MPSALPEDRGERMAAASTIRRRHGSCNARLWFGVAFMTLGVLWTLDNMYLIDAGQVLEWWPLVLVGIGLSKLFGGARPFAAALWIGVGILLLLHNTGVLPFDLWEMWPLFLVLLGASITWRALRGPRHEYMTRDGEARLAGNAPETRDLTEISAVAVWAGVDRKTQSQEFRSADFTAVMGGGSLDLRGARAAPGGAVVDIFVLMGGVEIFVSEDWHVVNDVFAFMGGIEDTRRAMPGTSDNVLYLKGSCIMGGVEIKN